MKKFLSTLIAFTFGLAAFAEAGIPASELVAPPDTNCCCTGVYDASHDLGAGAVPVTPTAEKDSSDTDKICLNPDRTAHFNGDVNKWIDEHIEYPPSLAEVDVIGRIIVRFVVNADGTLSRAFILRALYPDLDHEALRLVYSMPVWVPAKKDGENVASWYTLPVTFRLK